MRVLDPPKHVVVHRHGRWCDGELRAWRRDLDGWRGYVRYAVSPGLRYLEWVAAERVRPTQSLGAGRYVRARQSS
jgi:hypothetical protein